ncbi:TetR family transcriptional regulator [Nocardia sp. SYP-A9097]|uniref:TetR/AcrR family transcriptional regulator n=1 Tax=Nocardia sp. SYP-A9097 TaxID=2663237 RepID=UPI00129B4B05|nr:TetR/AcrR family transcriptional regulator [Nocardia sp. SYP-A9097]MRH86813.1 TetR family transcriptional regulator [Nocardia sp. SYP-A9097]
MNVVEPLRERLVSAGADMLEQVGAGQLGLRAIAREAGVSHGAPRRWFPTHNSLLAAIAARGYADLGTRLEAIQGNTPRDRLDRTCRTYLEFAVERPEMFTLMFRHDLLEGAGENLRATTTLPMFRRWRDLVATAGGQPAAGDSPDPDELALSLWTSLHGIATLVSNRSLEAMAPGFDPARLVTAAITRHLTHVQP